MTTSAFSHMSRSTSRSATPASSLTSKGSKLSKSSKSSDASKPSTKITERHFTPRTRRLAISSKAHVRSSVIYHPDGPFISVNGRMARMQFAWTTLKDTAKNSNDTDIKEAFARASKNDKTKKDLVTFVCRLSVTRQKLTQYIHRQCMGEHSSSVPLLQRPGTKFVVFIN